MKKDIRIAALPIALLSIVVGIAGIASPDGGMTLRRLLFAMPGLFYAVVAVRSAMGLLPDRGLPREYPPEPGAHPCQHAGRIQQPRNVVDDIPPG